jgi:hypothetical protein
MFRTPTFASLSTLTLAALLAACSDSPTPGGGGGGGGDGGVANKDATASGTDGGGNNGGTDGGGNNGGTDGGNNATPDSGVVGACDPVTGGGCPSPQACVFVNPMIGSQCRMLASMPKGHEAACDPSAQDCDRGFSCIQLDANNAICIKTCSAANGAVCDSLMGQSMRGYTCNIGLQGTDVQLCGPRLETCQILNDMCPMGQYCELVSQTDRGCVPEGTAMRGQACSPNNFCTKGSVCLNLGAGGQCEQACTANMAGSCGAGGGCVGLQGIEFGVCRPTCNPAAPSCGAGADCEQFSVDGTICIAGAVPPNAPSMAGAACTQGCAGTLTCVNGVCRVPCDAQNACATGMCNMIQGQTWGACL